MKTRLPLFVVAAALLASLPASPATFTVTNTNDGGAGSLRQAMLDANATPGRDTIAFSIGSGPQLILPLGNLPSITDSAVIDGTTQPGYLGAPLIGVDGSSFVSNSYHAAFDLRANDSEVIGLSITNFNGPDATTFQGAAGVTVGAPGCVVKRCYIGVGRDGNSAGGNDHGINIETGGAIIGMPGEGNVISAGYVGILHYAPATNASNLIQSNIIGLNAAGTTPVANIYGVGLFADGDTFIDNVVTGNIYGHFLISGTGVTLRSNLIGVTRGGAVIYGSSVTAAVSIYTTWGSTAAVVVGGPGGGDGNVIAGGSPGIYLDSSTGTQIKGNDIHHNSTGLTIRQSGGTAIVHNRFHDNFGSAVHVASGSGNLISENSMFHDSAGIQLSDYFPLANDNLDLDVGGNLGLNYPVLNSVTSVNGATTITGTLHSTPSQAYHLELFQSPTCNGYGYGEGNTFIGSVDVTTNASGNATFATLVPMALPSGTVVTATSTDGFSNTSEFSPCALVQGAGIFVFSSSTAGVSEGLAASLTVSRTAGSAGTASVTYTATSDTATSGSDFAATSGTLTFGPGETSKSFLVSTLQDTTFEGSERFLVTLSDPTGGAILGSPSTATVTINDDDPPPSISISDASQLEGDAGTTSMQFTVTRQPASTVVSTVQYFTGSSSASSGQDYQFASGTLIFNAGETSKTITVSIIGDTRFEPDEAFIINLYSPTNATVNDSLGIGTIVNDDARPVITFNDTRALEGNAGLTPVQVTLTADQPLFGEIDYFTADGTARADVDYQPIFGGYLYFNGETTRSFTVYIKGDTDPEPDERFSIRISYNSTGGIISPANAVVIANDDAGFGPKTQRVPLGSNAEFGLDLGIAPSAPFTLALSSSNGDVLDLPASVAISQTVTTFLVPAKSVGTTIVTATLPPPYSQTFTAEVIVYEPANLVIKPSPASVPEGSTLTLSASFEPPLNKPSVVRLAALQPSLLEVPQTITIQPGQSTAFDVKGLKKGAAVLVATLSSDHGDTKSSFFVDVTAPPTTPVILQILPANGPDAGGTHVNITGANLAASCALYFGGTPAAEVSFVSPTAMTATTPAHPAGTVDVLLACGSDAFLFSNGFTYLGSKPLVASVVPSFGSIKGGTLVRITGTNFRSGCWPFFGADAAGAATFVSASELIAQAPPHAAGKVTVALRCSGAEDGALANAFTYSTAEEPVPLINSVAPLAGAPGQSVTLTGVRFRTDDTVKFDGVTATILSSSPDTDVIRIPEMPAGDAAITLTDAAGHSSTTGPIFSVLEPTSPHIDTITPKSVRPGTDVVLDGTGFRPGYTYAFGATKAALISLTYTRILLRVPDVTPGTYPLNVLNAAGKIASIGPSVTVAATGPSIASISVACATTEGGGTMVIRGGGFAEGAVVTFDGTLAKTKFVDAGTLSVTIPAGAVGAPRIVITNPNGSTAQLGGAFFYYSPFDPNGGCSGGRSRPLRH